MKAHTEKEFGMEKLVFAALPAAAGLASGAVSRLALKRKEIKLANKKIGLVLLGMVIMGASLEAQQSVTFRNCENFWYRNSSAGPLVDMTYQVDSVMWSVGTGWAGITIYFNDGSLPLVFFFSEVQRQPDGSAFFSHVEQDDPETLEPIISGFIGSIKKEGNGIMVAVNRGSVNYLTLFVRQ
jgi:hypothetical protein